MERYRGRIFRLALRFTSNKAEAEDVLQEVFLTLYQKLDQFEGKSSFSTWLYRVVVNTSLMRLRDQGKAEIVSLEEVPPDYLSPEEEEAGTGPDHLIITEESLAQIEKAMEKMPLDLKTVFILRDIEGFSNEETAEIMNLTVPAVKSRLHRGRELLRIRLKKLYQDTLEQ